MSLALRGVHFGFESVGRFHARWHSSGRLHANMARRQEKRKMCLKGGRGAKQIIDEAPRWGVD